MEPAVASHQLVRRTMALVLAGGRGARLKQLTEHRCKPAVHFGGKFRIIDFTLSNCINSGIRRVGVLGQYESHSLLRHLQRGWGFLRSELNEMVEALPAQQRNADENWYRGTADAVVQNLDFIHQAAPSYIVVLAGDHVYKMDYSVMLRDHVEHRAGCTVGCIEVPRSEACAFGVMAVDASRRITAFIEKPAEPPCMPGCDDRSLASMGIYVFDAAYLYHLLAVDLADPESSHDFGRDVIPRAVAEGRAMAHPFAQSCILNVNGAPPYWRDVGTIDAFWSANLDLASIDPELNIYDTQWPIWTYQHQLPPAKFIPDEHGRHGVVANTLVSGGSIIAGSRISDSVLFSTVQVRSFCHLEQVVVLPNVTIGRGCHLRKVVIDRRCVVPDGLVVGEDPVLDARRFERTPSGVVLINTEMLARLQGP
jgi:glucose-1-phosphate adenylyltransferase